MTRLQKVFCKKQREVCLVLSILFLSTLKFAVIISAVTAFVQEVSVVCAFKFFFMYMQNYAYSVLTLSVGWQEGHPACRELSVGNSGSSDLTTLLPCIGVQFAPRHLHRLLLVCLSYQVVLECGPLNEGVCMSIMQTKYFYILMM